MAVVGSLVATMTLRHASFTRGCHAAARSTTLLGRAAGAATPMIRSFGAALVAATGPLLGFYAAFRAARVAETFQQEMNSSLAIAKNMTPALRKEMENLAKELAYQTKYSASELAKGYYFLFSAGLNAEQAMAALPVTARFSQAAMADMAEATDILTDAVTSLGLDSKDTATYLRNLEGVADMIAETSRNANASMVQFGQAVTNKVGPALKNLRIPLSEGLAILGAFASQSKKGQDAGTAFAITLKDMTDAALKNAEAFEKHGIRVFENGMVRAVGMIEDLEARLRGVTPQEKLQIVTELGLPKKSRDFTMMLVGMTKQIREWAEANRQAGGTVSRIAEQQLPAFTKAWEKVKAVTEAFMIDRLTPFLQDLGTGLGLLLDISYNAETAADSIDRMSGAAKGVPDKLTGWARAIGVVADMIRGAEIAWKAFTGAIFAALEKIVEGFVAFVKMTTKLDPFGYASSAVQTLTEQAERLSDALGMTAQAYLDEASALSDLMKPSQEMLLEQMDQWAARFHKNVVEPWDSVAKGMAGGGAGPPAVETIRRIEPPALVRAGTQEAYDLIRRHLNPRRQENLQKQQLTKTTEAVAVLARIDATANDMAADMAEIERRLNFEDFNP